MLRRTLLPIPTIAGKMDTDQKYPETMYVMIWYIKIIKMENQHTHFISYPQQSVHKVENYKYIIFLK